MKKPLLVTYMFAAVFTAAVAQNQEDTITVPTKARENLYAQFPMTAKTLWTRESENVYCARFKIYKSNRINIIRFDTAGNWLEKRIEMDFSQLPMSAKEELVRTFENFKPKKSVIIESPFYNPEFEVTIEKWTAENDHREVYVVELSQEGKLLKTPEPVFAKANTAP